MISAGHSLAAAAGHRILAGVVRRREREATVGRKRVACRFDGLATRPAVEFTSLGDATLKGFDEPVTLYEVRVGTREAE